MENHTELDFGHVRRNDWKWSPEVDKLLELYKSKLCECGCGQKLQPTRKQVRDNKYKNKPLRVLKGHHNRLSESKKWIKAGENHPFFGHQHNPQSLKKMSSTWYPRGKNHPDWKGGLRKSIPFRNGWAAIRSQVLKRDNFTCKICGGTNKRLDVHHKKPRREFSDTLQVHLLDNLITLCDSCHMKEENKIRRNKENGVKSGELLNGQSRAKPRDYDKALGHV